MNTIDTILSRNSVRKFNDKEISNDDLNTILIAAQAAPTACNKRPWEFYVVRDENIKKELKTASIYSRYASDVIIVVAGNRNRFLDKDFEEFWMQDCAAATQNILLSAKELGISSVWCGLYPVDRFAKRASDILKLGDDIIPMALIHLGYSDEIDEKRNKFDESLVHRI